MKYRYKAINTSGKTIEGIFEATSEDEVVAMIKGNNYIAVDVTRDLEDEARLELFTQKVKKKDLAIFCRQFYTMVDSGLGIVKALDILEKQVENKTLKKAVGTVTEDVQKGLTLSEAMEKHSRIFPSILIS